MFISQSDENIIKGKNLLHTRVDAQKCVIDTAHYQKRENSSTHYKFLVI